MRSILVVAAHPDDEVLGCGGTLAKLALQSTEVNVAVLGQGIMSRNDAQPDSLTGLHQAAQEVAELLGVEALAMFDLPDNRFDTVPLLEVVKIVEGLVECFQPHTIYTHWSGDLNVDHKITHEAVLTATRPMEGCSVKEIYAFEVPSSSEWAFGATFSPDTYVDITNTLAAKIQALQMYQSEIRSFPHPPSSSGVEALARWRGSNIGVEAAEAFQTIRRLV